MIRGQRNPNEPKGTHVRDEERKALAVKAVNRLIADVEAKRLMKNNELAETIAVCIRGSALPQLRYLKWLLEQQELERPGKHGCEAA